MLEKPKKKLKKPKKKLKNRNISGPQALADKAFSEYIRRSAADQLGNVRCVSCGTTMHWTSAHAGHYWRRGCFNVRYDERNVHPQCPRCNTYLDGNIAGYATWMFARYTMVEMAILNTDAHMSVQFKADDYDKVKMDYRAKLKDLDEAGR